MPVSPPEEDDGGVMEPPLEEAPSDGTFTPPSSLPNAPTPPADSPSVLPGPIYDSGSCEAEFLVVVSLRTSGVALGDLITQMEAFVLVLEDFAGVGLCLIRESNQIESSLLFLSNVGVDLNITFAVKGEAKAVSLLNKFEDAGSLVEILETLKASIFPDIQGISFLDGYSEINLQAPSDGQESPPPEENGGKASNTLVYVLVSIGAVVAVVLICAAIVVYRKQYRKHSVHVI